jgi:hypothetical protein
LVQKLWNWTEGGLWEIWGTQAREVPGCHEQSVLGESSGSSDDQNPSRRAMTALMNLQMETGPFWQLARGRACYILAKNKSVFCPCPKTLSETGLKAMNSLSWHREFQGSQHSGCDMAITRFFNPDLE